MNALKEIPTSGLSQFIANLAEKCGVSYEETHLDILANAITDLCDDEVTCDETENLIIALRKKGIIDGESMITLIGNYIDEKQNV